jgi:hypothetical protein
MTSAQEIAAALSGKGRLERTHRNACRATRIMSDSLALRSISRAKMVEARNLLQEAINDIDQLISPQIEGE